MSTSTTAWTCVCQESDLIAESGIAVWTEQGPVALFWLPGTQQGLYALGHYCPKGKANVLARGIVGDLKGQLVVASPLYKHHYSLTNGQCLEDAEVRVPVYPARIENGQVQLALSAVRSQAA